MQKEEMREKKRIIIWPLYLDLNLKREQGRQAPIACSVRAPKASEISRAAEKLGLHPELEADKKHPSRWYEASGMVVVDNAGPKSELLRKIGAEIIRGRGGKQ